MCLPCQLSVIPQEHQPRAQAQTCRGRQSLLNQVKPRDPCEEFLMAGAQVYLLKSITSWVSPGEWQGVCPAAGWLRDGLAFPGGLWGREEGRGKGKPPLPGRASARVSNSALKFESFSFYSLDTFMAKVTQ